MSILVVGLSHKSAPVATLEQAVLTGDARLKLLRDVLHADDVAGSVVVSTCNRVEIYADVEKFHSAVAAICELLARHSGVPLGELTPHLYVHYEDRAVQHLLAVTCGLDSMVVGESQILGQVRQSLTLAREQGTVDRPLSELGALALRSGKRAHAETEIDRAGANLLSVGLAAAAARLGSAQAGSAQAGSGLAGRSVLVVGAGSMSSLAVAGAARAGAAAIAVANRTHMHAKRLAATVSGKPADLTDLPGLIAAADLVISCTGAPGSVITADMVRESFARRSQARDTLVLLDLALPRDVEAGTAQLPGVAVIDLETLEFGEGGGQSLARDGDIAAVRSIVAEEFAAYLSAGRAATVAPTVVALREKAAQVVDAELARLAGRLDGLDPQTIQEIARSMRRVTDKLLHAPTVRVKELAGVPGAESYEAALRVLFDLDPDAVRAVVRADAGLAGFEDLDAVGRAGTEGRANREDGPDTEEGAP
jgi:glutamyl-tRNA reductase